MSGTRSGGAGRTGGTGGAGGTGADAYIGLDLGTSGLKGVALSDSGAIIARDSAGYRTHRPAPGACEQDPADWLAAVERVCGQLSQVVPARRWRGIGLSGMMPTLVTAGADGRPTGAAITWQDSRADARGDEFRERCDGSVLYRLTGQWVDGRYLLPMFGRVAAEDPGRTAATTMIASAKDYLFGRLTGEIATDPSTASGFGCYELETGRWNAAALEAAAAAAADRPFPALPPVLPSTACRPLLPEVAARLGCAQIPVCLGAADSVLGALGLGVREPGQVACIAGTSTVILGVTDRLVLDPLHRFLVTPLAEPGRWGAEMDLLATGSAIEWLAGLLGGEPASDPAINPAGDPAIGHGGEPGARLTAAALVALAAGVDPAQAPVVLPYLSPGEQGALWDPLLRGAVVGLSLSHGRRHLARGLVNGIVLESRRCLAVLDETGGFGRDLAVAGGSAADPAFRGDLADASRRRVSMPQADDAGYSARGAALIAARAVDGDWPPGAFATTGELTEPDDARASRWDVLWGGYESARQAVAGHDHAAHRDDGPAGLDRSR